MTFEYRDDASCDKLVAQPDTDDDRKPVVFISTTGLNKGVYVPLDRVEEVVAGIRDAARTASGQQPECAPCGDTGACNGGPCAHPDAAPWTADGRHGPTPAEMADRRIPTCYVQFMGGAHCATAPAVGQPAEAQATEARPPRDQWCVEVLGGGDEWAQMGSATATRQAAEAKRDAANKRYPKWADGQPVERRLVRETTTWTVEDETR